MDRGSAGRGALAELDVPTRLNEGLKKLCAIAWCDNSGRTTPADEGWSDLGPEPSSDALEARSRLDGTGGVSMRGCG